MVALARWDATRRVYHLQTGCKFFTESNRRVVDVRRLRWQDPVCTDCQKTTPEHVLRYITRKPAA